MGYRAVKYASRRGAARASHPTHSAPAAALVGRQSRSATPACPLLLRAASGPPFKSSRPHAPSGHWHGRDDRDARILQIRKGLREFRRVRLAGGKARLAQLLYGQTKETCGERSSAEHDRAAPLGLHILQAYGNRISHRASAVFAVDRARRLEVAHRFDEDVPDGDRVT